MRCRNCGWPNRPGETTCQKCGTPLDDSETMHEHDYRSDSSSMNATIPEHAAFDNPEESDHVCPKCGYPLRNNASKCPNCNYDVSPSQRANVEVHRATRMDNPALEKNEMMGTINPYMVSAASEPSFILRPVKRINEKKELSDLEYEGKKVLLTRSNTEPDNPSITSQNQAAITFAENKWFVEDLSEQGTTFIRVSKKTEIQDGDVLLLGNRLFEFHETED